MPAKNTFINTDDIIDLYISGISVKALADRNNVSRQVIYRVLRDGSVPTRGRSEAMYLRMASMTKDERAALSEPSHNAIRGKKKSISTLEKRAITMQSSLQYIGAGEEALTELIRDHGINCVPQLAVSKYNIDIGCSPVAVELKIGTHINPFISRFDAQKIEYLCKNGWAVFYVIVKTESDIRSIHGDKVAAFIQEVGRDPSLIGEYRVINRDGNLVSSGRFYP